MRVWLSASELVRARAHGAGRAAGHPLAATSRCRPAGSSPTAASSPSARWASSRPPTSSPSSWSPTTNGVLVKLKDLGRVELGAEDERSALRFKGTLGGRDRRRPPVEVQHHPGGRRDPARAAADPGVAAAGGQARHRLRRVDLRVALHPRGAGDAHPRRAAGRDHHLRLPAEPAGHDHSRPRDPDVHRRDLRDHVLPRVLDQQLHPARAHAGHRHRGGRRDHRAGERVPAPGGAGRESRGGRAPTAPARSPSPSSPPPSRWSRCSPRWRSSRARPGGCSTSSASPWRARWSSPGFVALTLTPMLCAKILRVPQRHGALYRVLESGFNALAAGYARTLRAARCATAGRSSGVVVLLTLGAVAGLPLAQARVRAAGGQGLVLRRSSSRPKARRWPTPTATSGRPRRSLDKTKDVDSYFSVVNIGDGVSRGIIFTNLVDFDAAHPLRSRTSSARCRAALRHPRASSRSPTTRRPSGSAARSSSCCSNPDFDLLVKGNDTLLARARQVKGLLNVDSDLRVNKPELTVNFDRDRAEDLGVPVGDVATTLQVLLGGNRTSTFTRNNKQYDVIVQLDPAGARHAERHDGPLRPGPRRRAGQARGAGQREGGRGAARAQPLQPGARRRPSPRASPRASPSARRSTR